MAYIHIHDLSPLGSELFQDSETFLNELSSTELESVRGGIQLEQFLLLLKQYSIASLDLSSINTLQTNFSNSINNNSFNGVPANTIHGQTINGLSLSNINTLMG